MGQKQARCRKSPLGWSRRYKRLIYFFIEKRVHFIKIDSSALNNLAISMKKDDALKRKAKQIKNLLFDNPSFFGNQNNRN